MLHVFLFTLLIMASKTKTKRHVSHDGIVREYNYETKKWSVIEQDNDQKQTDKSKQLALEGRMFDIKGYFPYLYTQKYVDFDDLSKLDNLFKINGNGLYVELNQMKKRKSEDQQHGDTGNNLWDSSILLAKCLEYNTFLMDDNDKDKLSKLLNVSNKNVMEIGAGTGFVGLAAVHCNANNVLLTDLNYCIENIQMNVDKNKHLWRLHHHQQKMNPFDHVSVFELDWFNPEGSLLKFNKLKENTVDVVIGTDVIWIKELVPILVNTLEYLYENVMDKEHGIIIIAEQIRSSLVSELFWKLIKTKGFDRIRMPTKLQHPDFVSAKIHITVIRKASV